jgi:cobalt/nickel transport system ATP-binding protein
MPAIIQMNKVSFHYGQTQALSKISLEIKKGESVAITGPNGSGKSTLLKLIAGIEFPTKGDYFFDQKPITENTLKDSLFSKSFHKRIGYVFQNSDVQLFCANVYDEIAFGPSQLGIGEEDVHSRVTDCLALLAIGHLEKREPYHLSEGEKKKVAIACVLSLNPDVIVLDEPLNNLDPKARLFLKDFLIRLNESGKTIISATHEYENVSGIFKRKIVLSEEHSIVEGDG